MIDILASQEFDEKTVLSFRAMAIEVVRRCDRARFGDSNHTIPNKHELAEFRRWRGMVKEEQHRVTLT